MCSPSGCLRAFTYALACPGFLANSIPIWSGHERVRLHVQAVFDSCRILDLRNATVSLGCVELLRGAPSLECLRLRSDFFTADRDAPNKHGDLLDFIAQLPVRFLLPTSRQTREPL